MTIDTTRIAQRHPPAALSSADTESVNGPVSPPKPAAACGKRRENKALSSDSKNCTPSGVIVTRYQVRNIEINTIPVPDPASTSPSPEFGPAPLEVIPARVVDDGSTQAAAGARSQDVEGVAAVAGAGNAVADPPIDKGVDRAANTGAGSNPATLELGGGAATSSAVDPDGVWAAPGVVTPSRLTGTLRGRTKAPHALQNPTSGGSGAPHCQQVIVGSSR